MRGTNAKNGKALSGYEHLRQSIHDILSTPLGTRVMRRDYGSRLYQLVDAPMNRQTILDLIVATAEALRKWEHRLSVEGVSIDSVAAGGRISLTVTGTYLIDGKPVTIEGITL